MGRIAFLEFFADEPFDLAAREVEVGKIFKGTAPYEHMEKSRVSYLCLRICLAKTISEVGLLFEKEYRVFFFTPLEHERPQLCDKLLFTFIRDAFHVSDDSKVYARSPICWRHIA